MFIMVDNFTSGSQLRREYDVMIMEILMKSRLTLMSFCVRREGCGVWRDLSDGIRDSVTRVSRSRVDTNMAAVNIN